MHAIKADSSPEKSGKSTIEYDSEYLRIGYWSTLLNLSGGYLNDAGNKQKTIFLNNNQHKTSSLKGVTKKPISLQNNYNFPIFNLYIYSSNTEKIIFVLPELPEKKSVQLEFNKDGVYELYFSTAESSPIVKTTFSISHAKNSYAKKFHWDSKSFW
jgi:hypothetical protein